MSSLLWIEDFEGGQYNEFSYQLFGKTLGLSADTFPNNQSKLKSFLKNYSIINKANFAEAQRFINAELHTVDNIVLDIDLNLSGEDLEEDEAILLPILKRWFIPTKEVNPTEEMINDAESKMKKLAGYLLFIDLVMYKGFPREHILFCSNHAKNLESINSSFEKALIEKPLILTKQIETDIAAANKWIIEKLNDPYLQLRRGIIDGCQYLQTRIEADFSIIRFWEFIDPKLKIEAKDLAEDLSKYLGMLEKLLPRTLPSSDKQRTDIHRVFFRSLAHEWNSADPERLKEHYPNLGSALH